MQAFNKFGQIYIGKTQMYIAVTGVFAFIGWLGVIAISLKKGPEVLASIGFAKNLLLQGTAACIFFLFINKIFKAYMDQQMFSAETLGLVISLARLIMLFALVIEPGINSLFDLISLDEKALKGFGVVTYMEHVNIVLFAAGYGLHLISVAHKVARDLQTEQDLTI